MIDDLLSIGSAWDVPPVGAAVRPHGRLTRPGFRVSWPLDRVGGNPGVASTGRGPGTGLPAPVAVT